MCINLRAQRPGTFLYKPARRGWRRAPHFLLAHQHEQEMRFLRRYATDAFATSSVPPWRLSCSYYSSDAEPCDAYWGHSTLVRAHLASQITASD